LNDITPVISQKLKLLMRLNTFAKNPLALNSGNRWCNTCGIHPFSEPKWGESFGFA